MPAGCQLVGGRGTPPPKKKKPLYYAWQVFCTLPTLKAHLSLGIVIVHCCAQSLLYMSNISRCRRPISRLTVESATAGDGPISSAAAAVAHHSNWFRSLFLGKIQGSQMKRDSRVKFKWAKLKVEVDAVHRKITFAPQGWRQAHCCREGRVAGGAGRPW